MRDSAKTGVEVRRASLCIVDRMRNVATVIVTGRNRTSVAPLAELGAGLAIPLDREPEKFIERLRRTMKEHGVNVILD